MPMSISQPYPSSSDAGNRRRCRVKSCPFREKLPSMLYYAPFVLPKILDLLAGSLCLRAHKAFLQDGLIRTVPRYRVTANEDTAGGSPKGRPEVQRPRALRQK